MRIEFGRPTKASSRLSPRRLTGEMNNQNISRFFRISYRGLAGAGLSRPSFGCNEANERLTHLRLQLLFPLLAALPLLRRRRRSPRRQPRPFPPEFRSTEVWLPSPPNARSGH